jgi:hypothetical protein
MRLLTAQTIAGEGEIEVPGLRPTSGFPSRPSFMLR